MNEFITILITVTVLYNIPNILAKLRREPRYGDVRITRCRSSGMYNIETYTKQEFSDGDEFLSWEWVSWHPNLGVAKKMVANNYAPKKSKKAKVVKYYRTKK